MKRQPFAVTVTAAATAALLLAGCGGTEPKPESGGRTTSADPGDKKQASPPAAPADSAGRPRVELPADLKLTFSPEETGDPTEDAVLADGAERMRAVNAAIAGTDTGFAAMHFYNTGKALEAASTWVENFKKKSLTITGAAHYFDRKVTLNKDRSASLTFCADESKGYTKNTRTGKVEKTPDSANNYLLYNTRLKKDSHGTWQTTQIISTRGVAKCRP